MKAVRPLYLPALYQDAADQGRLILRDGSTASMRLSQPADLAALREFYARLSPESRRMRFFSESKPGEDVLMPLCDSSNRAQQLTLLVFRFTDGAHRIVASGSYIAHNAQKAEFAVAVDDDFQGLGLGGLLLERLAVLAASQGFTEFVAVTHPTNKPMLETFRTSGFALRERFEDGCVVIDLSVQPREASVAHAEGRDRVFTQASIRPFFNPRSVAVIGASRNPQSFGHRIMDALIHNGFNGPVYPVNPNAAVVHSIKSYPSASAIPDPVDLAIISLPREQVLDAVDDCAARGIRAVIVISAGFAEAGPDGLRLQQQLVEKIRGYGMRLVGPNCLGVINTDPAVRLNASFAAGFPQPGRIALSSQSGALGLAILNLARQRQLGLSMFVSMGNKADVTGNDLLQYWEDDEGIGVILLYLESFGNPRRFARIARRVSLRKPIICVKSGRARALSGVTAARRDSSVTSETAVDALFRQTGVIRANSFEEMFDLATLIGYQPLPAGRRLAILSNSHGSGVLGLDTGEAHDLTAATLTAETRAKLGQALPEHSVLEPFVDMTAYAEPEHYRQAVAAVLADPGVDAVIVIYIPVMSDRTKEISQAIVDGAAAARAAGATGRPLLAVMMTDETASGLIAGAGESIPRYLFPEKAARLLGVAADYAAWRSKPHGVIMDFEGTRPAEARAVCRAAARSRPEGWLTQPEIQDVLRAYGIATAFQQEELTSQGYALVSIRVIEDPVFGPLIGIGVPSPDPTTPPDLTYRVTPLSDQAATEMISENSGLRLLFAHWQLTPDHVDAMRELLLRLSLLIEDIPEIRDMDFDEVELLPRKGGCRVVGARIRVESASQVQPPRYSSLSAD